MLKKIWNNAWIKTLWSWLLLVVGSFVMARSFTIFFVPNGIAPGGVTGIATLIHVVTGAPVGIVAFLLNIPLFLLGWREGGKGFMLRTVAATVLVSIFIDYLPGGLVLAGGDHDVLLSTIYGGLLLGVGIGLVFRAGATTGGTDLAASLVHKKLPGLRVAWILFVIDICVVISSALVSDIRIALYSLGAIFLAAKMTDDVQVGVDSSKANYIISNHAEEIKELLLNKLDRGVTVLEAKGGYTDEVKKVLFCVTSSREVPRLKKLVAQIDPEAFVIVTAAAEVMGEGFSLGSSNPMD